MARLPSAVRHLGAELVGAVPVRIAAGPNAGFRWSLASSGRGYRSGTFEAERIAAITALTRAGDRFWDVGAHKGYVSLAAARAVGGGGQVVAFEPAAANRALLRRHVRWNGLENVRIVPVAVSGADGEARFGGAGSSVTYRLGQGDEVVPTRTIGSLIERDGLPAPSVLKIDAEGSEAAILRGGLDHLSPGMLIWISVHSRELYHECRSLLLDRAFRLFRSAPVAERERNPDQPWGGDKELLAVGGERALSDEELRALGAFSA